MKFLTVLAFLFVSHTASALTFFEEYNCKDDLNLFQVRAIYSVGLDKHALTLFISSKGDLYDVKTLRFSDDIFPGTLHNEGFISFGAANTKADDRFVFEVPHGFSSSGSERPDSFSTYLQHYSSELNPRSYMPIECKKQK